MFCENCGANVPDDSKFCIECGITFTDAPAPVQQPVQPEIPVRVAPPPQPTYYPPPQQRPIQPAYMPPQPQRPIQPVYTPPPQPQYYAQPPYNPMQANREPLGVGSYIGMFFLSAIPLVGFIMLLVWAFGGDVNLNRKNYARAILIMALIGVAIGVIFFLIALAIGGSILSSFIY